MRNLGVWCFFLQVMRLGPGPFRVIREKLLLALVRARAESHISTGLACLYANISDPVSDYEVTYANQCLLKHIVEFRILHS